MLKMPRRPVLSLSDVVKTFPGVVALGGVSLDVLEGEVHALVGENGAGKSTLMAVAAGAIARDSGTIEIGGEPFEEASPAVAQALGISVVYQHTSVLDDLTVAENLLYCVPAQKRWDVKSNAEWIKCTTCRGWRPFRQPHQGQRTQRGGTPAGRDRQSAGVAAEGAGSR